MREHGGLVDHQVSLYVWVLSEETATGKGIGKSALENLVLLGTGDEQPFTLTKEGKGSENLLHPFSS